MSRRVCVADDRDDYLHDLLVHKPPAKSATPRARTRNQYTQLARSTHPHLTVEETPSAGICVYLMRDAGVWHRIAHRLVTGGWDLDGDARMTRRVEEEVRWAGMDIIRRDRSGVRNGGKGYF